MDNLDVTRVDRFEVVPSPDPAASVSIASSRPMSAVEGVRESRQEMMDEGIHYPLQPRSRYMSPSPYLSFESKRIIRQAQDPLYVTAPRVSHFLYEVIHHVFSFYCFSYFAMTMNCANASCVSF